MTVGVPDVAELLRGCQRSAVHLEMRDGYMRSDPMFVAWQQGRREEAAHSETWWRAWLDLLAQLHSRGVVLRRARIVSEPVSEYIRFEYDVTVANVAGGEQVRWLPRRRASDLLLPGNDFWVFDDRLVLWNYFTGEGEVAPDGREITEDPVLVKTCISAFESVWDRAIPHEEYRPL